MSERIQKLELFESKDIFPLATRSAGVYEFKMTIQGAALRSTVFVQSATGSVLVEYFDYSTGGDEGEENALQAHANLSSPSTHKIEVSDFNNKLFARCTVTGSVRFGVLITVLDDVSSFSAKNGDTADLVSDTGSPLLTYDDSDGKYYFLKTDQGNLAVSATIVENIRQRILKDPLLERSFSWQDFGTKNQRIGSITYETSNETSSLVRAFVYTLVGTRYRLDTDTWTVI